MADEKEVDKEDENVSSPPDQEGEIDASAGEGEDSASANDAAPETDAAAEPGEEDDTGDAPEAEGESGTAEVSETSDALGKSDDESDDEAGAAGEQGEDGSENGSEDEAEDEAEEEPEDGEAEEGESLPMTAVVEAILFAAREPLKPAQIARAVGKRTRQDAVRAAVEELNVHYLETGRAFEIAEISERYQLMSRPEYARHIMRIYPKRELHADKDKSNRLTPAAMDTLAIIAYKQPVMRSEIERIRGVACGPVLKMLIERGSVKQVGRRTDLVGKPSVFGTTEKFLAEFGLGSLDELPLRNDYLPAPGEEPQVELLPEEGENAEAASQTDAPGENGADAAQAVQPQESAPDTEESHHEPEPETGVEGAAVQEATETAEGAESAEDEPDGAEPPEAGAPPGDEADEAQPDDEAGPPLPF
ncbi:MAG: SMC-Scp complex subunit ScpB [Planctomycetaceae bacterium]|nr:SMC-Scp complex subunit ScpB [Planctomycetaceae bacterium]